MQLLFFFLVTASVSLSFGYKVLVYYPVPSKSHANLGRGVVRALLDAGHEVSWVTPFPELAKAENNLTTIDVSENLKLTVYMDSGDRDVLNDFTRVVEFSRNISLWTMRSEGLRKVLINEQFDVIVSELFFDAMPAGIAAVQQVPWVMVSPIPLGPTTIYYVDDPLTMVTIPNILLLKPTIMDRFVDRLKNTIANIFMLCGEWSQSAVVEKNYNELFEPIATARGVPLKPIGLAQFDIAIMLVNSHPSIYPSISVPPNVIDIGGYHIDDEVTPLPKDLQDLLDNSTDGVVYFSMGSVINGSQILGHAKDELFRVLGGLKQTVLWKFETTMEGLPKNVHIRSWMPQTSILAHKNAKVFITHGGLLSTFESIKYGVPQVLIPVFGDQAANALRAEIYGFGLRVEFGDDLAQNLEVKLKEVLENDRYSKKAKELSFILNNQPVHPRKLISAYVELAVETKGAHHLRPISHQYTWYQRYMLDIIAFVLLIVIIILKLVIIYLRRIFTIIKGPSRHKKNN